MHRSQKFLIIVFVFFLTNSLSWSSPSTTHFIPYITDVVENKVIICIGMYPKEIALLDCPNRKDLLRENVQSKEVVMFTSPICDENKAKRSAVCYVDECVPPGTYRYGLAVALPCREGYDVDYYAEVKVTNTLSSQCVRSKNNLPVPVNLSPPWGWKVDSGPTIPCRHCGCSTTTESHTSPIPWLPVFLTLLLFFAAIRKSP